jgi:hypothetical protein
MNYCKQEEKLLNRIENLRKQLNKKINVKNNTPQSCPRTYAISRELDRLIYQYMIKYHKTL